MSPVAESVLQRLDSARQKWWLFTLLATTVLAACVSFGLLLLFTLTDALLKLTQVTLLGMFLVWLAVTVALIAIVGRRLARSQRSLEATARRVEAEYPELGSDLINLVQLSEGNGVGEAAFREAAVQEAAARVGPLRFEGAATKQSRWGRLLQCMQTPRDLGESILVLGGLIAVTAVFHLTIPNWGSAASRLMTPWKFVPSVGSTQILKVTPGDADVMLGENLQIGVEIKRPPDGVPDAVLFVTPEGEPQRRMSMAVDPHADPARPRYRRTLPSVVKPLRYRLEVGDSQTRVYSVAVRHKPVIDEVRVTLKYPLYLNRPDETFRQRNADLEAPQYTEAELWIRPSVPIAEGYVQLEGERLAGSTREDGERMVVKMPLLKDGTFTVHLVNDAGHGDPSPRRNRIRVLPDEPPQVQMPRPARQSSASPGGEVAVMIRASDDYGLDRLRLEMKIREPAPGEGRPGGESEPGEAAPTVVRQWADLQGAANAVRQYRLGLDPERARPGRTVLIRAVARDGRRIAAWGHQLQPQETSSDWHAIRIVGRQEEAAAALKQLDDLHATLWRILEKQVAARVRAAAILPAGELAERRAPVGDVRAQQIRVQEMSLGLVKSIGRTDRGERLTIKRTLNNLALGEMLEAVRRCDELLRCSAPEQFVGPVGQLLATQDRIIEVLRKLLDVVRHAQREVLAEMESRPGGDLPNDAQQALEELDRNIEEALSQQKKVVEAAENLAKAPVEDFAEAKEQLLEALAAAEDDWSKFLTELNTDLSKLPEQDFANPSLLQEVVEIQTEIKMAEDALLKKTADIAVPLEQLGYEMAEEIKKNLEKWLPDTPDRERWSQEESLTDADKEAPMAELPGELEDLVGELIEEEEDLFDEMEDVSSSAADSLDKGAGWDVMDGPISNMSAKGATGNRLPNTSEIGGRAGEGRSGKSSGEFVGEEAVGKGGRRTPSRLTPDPYVAGQVKDHSRDPTGGATGGGKESGQGGEGLEGPAPGAPGPRQLQRLAGKQATLRDKAEGIDVQLQIMNFHHTDLRKMIELMARVERDLRAGRYRNAVRQRKVLVDGLGNVKQYLEGEFEVRRDMTSNLPSEIQKQILGSIQDRSPIGWEQLNRQYFERLSAGEVGPADAGPATRGSPPGG